MSYAQALEQQLTLMREMHRSNMQRYAIGEMGCEESGRKYLQRMHDTLEVADPYYWAPDICAVVDGVWREMPEWTLRRDALPGPHGFFWFARPFSVPCPSDCGETAHADHLVGVTWGTDETLLAGVGDGDDEAVTFFSPVVVADAGDAPATGMLIPWCCGWSRGHMVEQWPDGGPLRAHNDAVSRIVSACLAFIDQRILVSRPETPPRASRKRAAAQLKHEPLVRVVELRRRHNAPSERSGESVVWSCRWVVSGHWRRQYYPATDEHRPLFILPYVKGDPSQPLKPPRAKVFAVIR